MDIEDELRGYAVDHEPDGWPAIRMDKLMQAANEIGRLRDELAPTWNDVGEAATLAAAAEDADEWLALIERLHGRGVWKFSDGESLQKLRGCRESLRSRLRHNAGIDPRRQASASDDLLAINTVAESKGT